MPAIGLGLFQELYPYQLYLVEPKSVPTQTY